MHIVMRVGSVMAMLETATGRAFAAFLPPKILNGALESKLDHLGVGFDPNRMPKSQKVTELLAEVRRHGLARAVGDPLPGVNAFAAPVFDHAGHVTLVITAMGPAGTFDARWDSPIAKTLRACAAGISKQLGFSSAPRKLTTGLCRGSPPSAARVARPFGAREHLDVRLTAEDLAEQVGSNCPNKSQ